MIAPVSASATRLRASDPNSNEKYQHSPDNHLKSGAEKGRVHITVSNPADGQKFNCHDHNGDGGGSSKTRNQIWQGVTDSSGRGHQSADDSTKKRFAAAGQAAVIRSCLGEPHRNSCSDAGGEADQERGVAVVGRECCCKNRRKR